MTKLLQDRTALITGAGSGIGRDLALTLAEMGARVGVAVRRPPTGEETAQLITDEGGEAHVIAMDLTDEASVKSGVAEFVARTGGLDIMVHNANNSNSAYPAPAAEVDRDAWLSQSRVALGGAFLTAREAHPHLKRSKHARYFTLSSAFGFHGAGMNTVYAAQKSAFRGFVRSLAREWGPDGITVNAIGPSAATDPTRFFLLRTRRWRKPISASFQWEGWATPDVTSPPHLRCSALTRART